MSVVLPRPERIVPRSAGFQLGPSTRILAAEQWWPAAVRLQEWLRAPTGFVLPISAPDDATPSIRFRGDEQLAEEAYRIEVDPAGVNITAGGLRGALWAAQVLRQLLPPRSYRQAATAGTWIMPGVRIEDAPRFSWRGAMLDVARHFWTPAEVRRFIDLMAIHRLNVLHLHLTDDQGWRLEIKRYPRLTEMGSWRSASQVGADADRLDDRPHGGYYTHDDIRELVSYAAARGIDIVPEIDLPGHVRAVLAAYPELGVTDHEVTVWNQWGISPYVLNAEERTIEVLGHIFDEVMDLFPSELIGVGGDECLKTQWRESSRTQERMRELGLADEEELQSWFIRRLADHLAGRNRRVYGWDEILEGGAPAGAVVASWRGMAGAVAAARAGHDVVACPDNQVYLDYRQSEDPEEPIPVGLSLGLEEVYAFDPVPPELTADEAQRVLGGQANIWTEHIDTARRLDYMAFPRLCAVAEVLWSQAPRDFDDFSERLSIHLQRLAAAGVEFRPLSGPKPWQQRPGVKGREWTRAERAAEIAELTANITLDSA